MGLRRQMPWREVRRALLRPVRRRVRRRERLGLLLLLLPLHSVWKRRPKRPRRVPCPSPCGMARRG